MMKSRSIILVLLLGDLLPADGLIVQSSDLKIDESSLTGKTFCSCCHLHEIFMLGFLQEKLI